MNDTNKEAYLDALVAASGIIDKILYFTPSGICYDIQSADWEAAASGSISNDSVMDFTNSTGSSVTISGVGLFSSGAQTLTSGTTTITSAVDLYYFAQPVVVDDGETLRLSTYDYTVN